MRFLVTGANGQLGNELRTLSEMPNYSEHTYYFTDVTELDICDEKALFDFFSTHEVDVAINCAAYTAVDKAEENEALCEKINAVAPQLLAQAAQAHGARVLQVSTDYVFDGTHCRPYLESDDTAPVSVYGRTKLAGEEAVMNFCPLSAVVRTAWLYSTHGNNFVKTMIRLGREREELSVVADQVGTPTYAADLAEALLTMAIQGIQPGIYHYTNEGVASWYDFTVAIHRLAGVNNCKVKPIRTEDYPTPAARPAYSLLSKTKIKTTYSLEIPHWEEALKLCIKRLES
ncbi:MAG TPA: dTDP-4-dehydrorhamnose reductase [Bacteroidaceae bacterium]|nr:dTDP-4-dehydrorhamnose reductase [Bacteroidaceae bacterium]